MQTPRADKQSVLSHYFAEIREYPLLTRDEERDLARDIQRGDQRALHELVESNLSFVAKVASEYRNFGIPFEDLLNEGNLGLIEAARRFDASKDTKFISYAIWWIRKSILKALSDKSHVVRMPYSQLKKFKEIRKAERTLQPLLGRRPSREEISEYLEKSVSNIDRVLQYGVHESSIYEPVNEEHATPVADVLVHDHGSSPEQKLLEQELNEGVGEAYCQLTRQQRLVLAYRFGLLGDTPLTLQETGERMGVSRERVRQIEVQAKSKLRKLFDSKRRIQPPHKRRGASRAGSRDGQLVH
jgi:RNA polymerase primary sigma factor